MYAFVSEKSRGVKLVVAKGGKKFVDPPKMKMAKEVKHVGM